MADEDLLALSKECEYAAVAAADMAAHAADHDDEALAQAAVERRPSLEQMLDAERAHTELIARLTRDQARRANALKAAGASPQQIADAQRTG